MGANMELQFHVGGIATRVNLWIKGVREGWSNASMRWPNAITVRFKAS